MTNVLNLIDEELNRASAPRASRKPVFLFLSEGYKALVRPLYNLDKMLALSKHSKWNDDPDYRVNAICAKEIGKSCGYCERAADDKKLRASNFFYLPMYVYNVVDTHTGQHITYKDPETQEEKPIAGIRLLELSSFGRVSAILKFFMSFYKDPDNGHDIRVADFSIEQSGSGPKKDFIIMVKTPAPMSAKLQAIKLTPEQVKQRILEACPPLVGDDGAFGGAAGIESDAGEEDEDDDSAPAF